MDSVQNLANLASMAVYTFRNGSRTERLILGSALVGTGLVIAQIIYEIAVRLFSKPHQSGPVNHIQVDEQVLRDLEVRLQQQFLAVPPPAPQSPPAPPPSPPELQAHPLLASLSVSNEPLSQEKESQLAEALHAYQELKTEIGGHEEWFVFFAEEYLRQPLPEKLRWKAIEFTIPEHFNGAFQALDLKLRRVKLNLGHVKKSEQPIAKAQFRDGSSQDIHDLSGLYKTVKLLGPHILMSEEVRLKKNQITEAKRELHKTRLEIIDKVLSTLKVVLIDELVISFPEKQKDFYPLFGNNLDNLRFVLENICWHALDRALESFEITFVPTEEKKQKSRQSNLEDLLKKGIPEGEKRKQGQEILLEISKNPHNEDAVHALVRLLMDEKEPHSEREALIRKIQEPKLQLDEERIQQDLGSLEAVQKFYTTVSFCAGVIDHGKNALRNPHARPPKKPLIARPIPPLQALANLNNRGPATFAQEIEKVSRAVIKAGERAIRTVADQRWQSALLFINREKEKIPDRQAVDELIKQGWTGFESKERLMALTGHQRWLITQLMILRKLEPDFLQAKGKELVHEVGKWAASFVKTLYGRVVTALLTFEQRTREATPQDAKPADKIAEALINPLVSSYQALQQVKKGSSTAFKRENAIVVALGNKMHPSASKSRSADPVFLGKLILELLSILQPKGLSDDFHKVIVNALSKPGELEPTLLRKMIEKYNTIRPGVEPWIKPVGDFLFQALENLIEKQSASNMASQMSDWLDPVNINSYLADLLMQDTSKIEISPPPKGDKVRLKWYQDDENALGASLKTRAEWKLKIELYERTLADLQKRNISAEQISKEWIDLKRDAAILDGKLISELLRRIVIASVPASLAGYALQFVEDLFELIQYPRILRNIVFPVLEETVQSLSQPLEESQADAALGLSMGQTANQPIVDFLLSDLAKASLGNKLLQLVWSLSPTENTWSTWVFFAQAAAKTIVPGYSVFSKIQKKIEELVQVKFHNDPEVLNWSVAKLVATMNEKLTHFAKAEGEQGMQALVAAQLNKALGDKRQSLN